MQFKLNTAEHPDKAALLAWAEGELSWWRGWLVGRHVRSCWQCKGQVRELEDLVCAVTLGIEQMAEPSRVDTSKALWRFRQACLELEETPRARGLRLRPAWTAAASVILATAGLAYVANWPRFQRPSERTISLPGRHRAPLPAEPVIVAPEDENSQAVQAPPLPDEARRTPETALGPTEDDLLSTEIQALAALHRSRFCLNSGITVRRSGAVVEIQGTVQSGDERDRIAGVLSGIGRGDLMRILLTQPEADAERIPLTKEVQPGGTPETTAVPPPVVGWLRQSLGVGSRRTERDMFNLMNSMVLESERVSSESWALRHLAEQFPLRRTRQLRPELADQILQMVDDHAIALANDLHQLQTRLALTLETKPAQTGDEAAIGQNEHWQDRVLALHLVVEDVVRRLLASMSTDAGATSPSTSVPPRDFSALFYSINAQTGSCLAAAGELRADIQAKSAEARSVQGPNLNH